MFKLFNELAFLFYLCYSPLSLFECAKFALLCFGLMCHIVAARDKGYGLYFFVVRLFSAFR